MTACNCDEGKCKCDTNCKCGCNDKCGKQMYGQEYDNVKTKMHSAKIRSVVEENYRVKTLEMDIKAETSAPGQFLMVWLPGTGERPMSVGNNNPLTISVANVGPVSDAISKLKPGDIISYRGPLGKQFSFPKKTRHILLIAGGYGVVPMRFLAQEAKKQNIKCTAVLGARSANDLVYEKQLSKVCEKVLVTTDDGSRGTKGNVLVEAQALIEARKANGGGSRSEKFDCVYCCGPEKMMYAVALACKQNKVLCQVSIERYMKCGVGVCGSCDINGRLCCVDGPAFSGEEALSMSEFGKAKRDGSGRFG